MEERLDCGGEGEAAGSVCAEAEDGTGTAMDRPTSCAMANVKSEGAAVEGGTVPSDGRSWQQAMPSMLAAESSQPCIIPWQQAGWDAGITQASAGSAVHMTTAISNTSARFLPTCIVYSLLENEPSGEIGQ
jgi:hypothetical protein